MLFNSLEFAVFLPILFILYWFVANKSLRLQNLLLLLGSYFFYAWWDWRFLSLIFFSSLVDYLVAITLAKTTKSIYRKLLLYTSILVNIGFLGFFKYFNFFAESFSQAFTLLGMPIGADRLDIILPVGISFYTFQTLSYTIDVYRKRLPPTTDVVAFFTFVSFFPQLVAGPIERASNLLPQFQVKRALHYSNALNGSKQILWGLFKKVVIADNCARYVNLIFEDPTAHSGSMLFLGAILFSFQIYGDFSGYTDIAIGTARLFGFELMKNFAYPYFSRDIAEFWRRWHISLSTWFRDYLYIPLGGSRGRLLQQIRNVFVVFIVSGFWHGANWTFLLWGALHALFFLPLLLFKNNRSHLDIVAKERFLPNLREVWQMLSTFLLTTLAWILFRAETIGDAYHYYHELFSRTLFTTPKLLSNPNVQLLLIFIAGFITVEWLGRREEYAIESLIEKRSKWIRLAFYYGLAMTIVLFGATKQDFIYFQF